MVEKQELLHRAHFSVGFLPANRAYLMQATEFDDCKQTKLLIKTCFQSIMNKHPYTAQR